MANLFHLARRTKRMPSWLLWLFVVVAAINIGQFFLHRHTLVYWAGLVFWSLYLLSAGVTLAARRRNALSGLR